LRACFHLTNVSHPYLGSGIKYWLEAAANPPYTESGSHMTIVQDLAAKGNLRLVHRFINPIDFGVYACILGLEVIGRSRELRRN
jgi:hypothetical protein